MNLAKFYCIKGDHLADREQASLLFQTGFYRVKHPMGVCSSCAERSMNGSDSIPPGQSGRETSDLHRKVHQ